MKRIKTELPITIVTDDEHKQGDNLEMTRQRIEQAAFYVISLLNTVRYTLENLPDFGERKIEEAVWDARRMCELGYAVADTILASASCLTEFQPDEIKGVCGCKTDTAPESNIDSLAKEISSILKNPDLPNRLQTLCKTRLPMSNRSATETAQTPNASHRLCADSKSAMSKQSKAGSLKAIFHGFRRLSPLEQIAYLRYLELVIERNTPEKRRLIRFKLRLEKEVEKQFANA